MISGLINQQLWSDINCNMSNWNLPSIAKNKLNFLCGELSKSHCKVQERLQIWDWKPIDIILHRKWVSGLILGSSPIKTFVCSLVIVGYCVLHMRVRENTLLHKTRLQFIGSQFSGTVISCWKILYTIWQTDLRIHEVNIIKSRNRPKKKKRLNSEDGELFTI